MKTASLCFCIGSDYASSRFHCANTDAATFEEIYLHSLKKIISFLYSHPQIPFSWNFSGRQLEYYGKKHPEFIALLRELVSRKQVELMGGGYYDPLFPLLLPADCIAQVELLSALHYSQIGPRPRGIALSDCWDPRLIISFNKCKMDFVQMDVSLIAKKGKEFSPLTVENQGKTISVLPVYPALLPDITMSPTTYFNRLITVFSSVKENSRNPVAVCTFSPHELESFIESGWLEELGSLFPAYARQIHLTTPSLFLAQPTTFTPAYIPPGIINQPLTIYDYMQSDRELRLLYSRMMHLCLLISQFRGDKARKKAAMEKLWEGQAGEAYRPWLAEKDTGYYRRAAYRSLIQGEKIIREAENFTGSISSFDFDSDGVDEYVCRFDNYNAFVSKTGGSVFELDVFQSALNYGDSQRCFVDHLVSPPDFERFTADTQSVETVFPDQHYTEALFDRRRGEIRLAAEGYFGNSRQRVMLKKNYRPTNNGIQVQYILANESESPLKAIFAVELGFSIPGEKAEGRKLELVTEQGDKISNTQERFIVPGDITCSQITDVQHNMSFVTEPNEASGFFRNPVRTESVGRALGMRGTLFWHIDLSPGRETEKTINLAIIPSRQPRAGAKKK
ncbi:MAG: DUF1926 domain-containing protein [Treponema sp.]|jgi:hypothetical protein|nr:DUF1926 domain-containing protein [Treponema sp.]